MSGAPRYVLRRVVAVAVLVVAIGAVAAAVLIAGGDSAGDDPPRAAGGDAGARTTPARTSGGDKPKAPAAGPARDMGRPGPPRPVPILMYHVTTAPIPNAAFPDLYVSKEEFADQMRALRDAGYTAVTQDEVWAAWHDGGPLPQKPVVISIDDGYRSNFLNAYPILRRLGWPAVLNLKLGNLREPDYGLTEAQVRELIDAGWEIDSHTIDHPDLTTVDDAQLAREVADSRRALREQFGVEANWFCYPAGRYDERVIAAVEAAGYRGATTVNPGLAQPGDDARFELDRVRVNAGVSGATLVGQLDALTGA